MPLTGSRRLPLLPRGGCPNDAIRHQTKGPEAVKQRTRDVDAGAALVWLAGKVRLYCVSLSLMAGRGGGPWW